MTIYLTLRLEMILFSEGHHMSRMCWYRDVAISLIWIFTPKFENIEP